MTERIRRLREQSLAAPYQISAERALLVTEFYRSERAQNVSVPVRRALALEHILAHKHICINDGELIVGERGPAPRAVPTYPEVTCHSVEDLEILNSRPKTNYDVEPETIAVYRDRIVPFWRGRSMRDRIFAEMSEEWKAA